MGRILTPEELANVRRESIKALNKMFNKLYGNTDDMEETKDFGWALNQMKNDRAVFRTGWNGQGMCIFLIKGRRIEYNQFTSFKNNACQAFNPPEDIIIIDHIDMRAADGKYITGWLASQSDMLAEDWELYN